MWREPNVDRPARPVVTFTNGLHGGDDVGESKFVKMSDKFQTSRLLDERITSNMLECVHSSSFSLSSPGDLTTYPEFSFLFRPSLLDG